MSERQTKRLVREGAYIAEVDVTLVETEHEWAPYLSAQDVRKLDDVRLALRRGDLATAARLARVYELKPVAAE
ncbi:MAG TPA: hypothetical protein VG966_08375 [Hyphomicrobiaceae bacterium]|nr:hypothetical protein [Hyphomicrobiaceae bacterium]